MADGTQLLKPAASPEPQMKRRILDAAAKLLAENGYQATTLRGIADAAGLKAGSIYYHFPSKEQITVEVLNEGVRYVSQAVIDAVDMLGTTATGEAIISAAIEAHLAALSEHKAHTRASIRCFSVVPEDIRSQTVASRRLFDGVWLDVLKKAQKTGAIAKTADLKSLHLIILGALNWTIERRGADTKEHRAMAATLTHLVLG